MHTTTQKKNEKYKENSHNLPVSKSINTTTTITKIIPDGAYPKLWYPHVGRPPRRTIIRRRITNIIPNVLIRKTSLSIVQ
jgi:hypothetical protein